MAIKVCFNNQTHRISKLPDTYKALLETIKLIFDDQLPQRWTLQYLDSDGDTIMLSDENDFKNLVEDEITNSTKTVKVFVLPLGDLSHRKESEGFQVIEKVEPPKAEEPKETGKIVESAPVQTISQNQEEKTSQSEELPVEKSNEVEPQGTPQPKKEGHCHRFRMRHHKLKKILKKLAQPDITPEKKQKLEGKLRKFEEELTPEQKEKVQKKKEKIAKRLAEKEDKKKAVLKETVTDLLYEHLPTIASLTKEFIQDGKPVESKPAQSQAQSTTVVHENYTCDGCNAHPIVGVRYKCSVCHDFDYCEKCEANIEHPHPFLKIKKPEQMHFRGGRGFGRFGGHHGPFGGRRRCPWSNQERQEGHEEQEERRGPCRFPFGGFGGFRGCFKPEEREKMRPFFERLREFKRSDTFRNLMMAFFSGAQPEQTEKLKEEVQKLFNELPKEIQEMAIQHYQSLTQEFRNKISTLLGGLPEEILKKQEKKEEKQEEEVKIEEIPVPKDKQSETNNDIHAPVIQEISQEKEKIEEVPKKEYPADVTEKAKRLKEIFSETSLESLCEFVLQGAKLSFEELVENYLTL